MTRATPSAAPPAKPSLELLRSLSDEHVLRALMQARRLTRADLASRTGLSKPTVGESVRRLTQAGLLLDTGERTPGGRGRGRVGSYYALAGTMGSALVASIAPDGVVAESVDAFGDTVARAREAISRPARPAQVTAALLGAAAQVQRQSGSPTRLAVVSAADPVERGSGGLAHLADSPFLLGELNPAEVLAPQVGGPVMVDNDVNWAARPSASRAARAAWMTSPMSSWEKGWAAPSSAMARSAGGTRGWRARSRTSSPSARTGRPCA